MDKIVKSRVDGRKWEYSYYTTDIQGSTRQEITQTQINNPELVEGPNTYYAYGTPIPMSSSSAGSSNLNSQTQKVEDTYTGQKKDEETNLMYYNARYYNPQTGLFIQADRVDDGFNKYQYVASNPINNTDPSGNSVDDPEVGSGTSSKKGKSNGVIIGNGINLLENKIQSEKDKANALMYLNTEMYSFLQDTPVIWGRYSYETQTIQLLDSNDSSSGGGAFTHIGDSGITKYFNGIAVNYDKSGEGSTEALVHEFSHVWFETCIQKDSCGIDTEEFKDYLVHFTFSIATSLPDSSKKQFGVTTDQNIFSTARSYVFGDDTKFQGFFCNGADSSCVDNYRDLAGSWDLDGIENYYSEHKDSVNYHELFASFSSSIFLQIQGNQYTMDETDKAMVGLFFPQLNFNR